ncbi:MAG TPA: T3SS effector HopA1 family protein [Bryobacteraceae bacterium]|nr:T3SS effector HopA1 family protein [Bryobacteraceae bacterium]
MIRIIDAVVILSPTAFRFAGKRSTGIAMPMPGLQLTPGMPPLMSELTSQLYDHCFSKCFSGQIAATEVPQFESGAAQLEALSGANESRERWEDGWQVIQGMPNGQVLASRGGKMRALSPGEFVNLGGSGMAFAPGTVVRIFVPRDSRTLQPGYYFAFGETLPDYNDEYSVVRFYWNVTCEGSAELLRLVSRELNRWQVPFRLKTGTVATMFRRRDSAVLYTPRRYAPFTFEIVSQIHARVLPLLRDDVPLFTLRLAAGFAFAEDPGTQESFGMSRCRMLAQALWLAHAGGVRESEERFHAVAEQFQAGGISLERPWLNAGSANEFPFAEGVAEAA